jgi:hypothetical protein
MVRVAFRSPLVGSVVAALFAVAIYAVISVFTGGFGWQHALMVAFGGLLVALLLNVLFTGLPTHSS